MAGMTERPGLTCIIESSHPTAVLRLAGQLDLAATADVRTVLHKSLAEQPSAILVDLTELAVTDDIALIVFTAFARSAAGWPGCPVLLCGGGSGVAADLDRMGVNRWVPVYPDRARALAAAATTPAPLRCSRRLWPEPSAARAARQTVAEACRAWRVPELVDDAQIIVTELVSNAVRHAVGEPELLVLMRERFLHVSVRDGSPYPPRRILPDLETGAGGRGLVLVDAVAASWGTILSPPGKVVWATIRRPR
jgi:anti-sigma regulatory factor (Ser/Thr protein kinase)/anti-anti-sigma regulatory factor